MKKKLQDFPIPLQNLIINRTVISIVSFWLGLVMGIFFRDARLAIPGILLCLITILTAAYIYRLVVQNRFLALRCTVMHVDYTVVRRRCKTLLLEVEGKALRVHLRNRHLRIERGTVVSLYVAETAQIYAWRGMYQLNSYLALAVQAG